MKKYSLNEKKELAKWASDCVERVLFLFEDAYPSDDRPRKALEVCREWVRTGVFRMPVIREASLSAHAAARSVKENSAAFNVARAAGQAVATAHVPQHAFGVFYALRAVAAAYPENAEEKVMDEYLWQSQHIPIQIKTEYEKRIVIQQRKSRLCIFLHKDKDL